MEDAVRKYLSERARIAGSATSEKKAAASRLNGKLGGRPKGARKVPIVDKSDGGVLDSDTGKQNQMGAHSVEPQS